jgi:hypothetical protein
VSTFLILGDSWSQGEIQDGEVVHQGLTQFLEDDGHTVHNRGGLGFSNEQAYQECKKALDENIDYIIWFVTDSLRDLSEQEYIAELKQKQSVKQVVREAHHACYSKFNQLDIPVYLIGAWAPVVEDIDQYANLKVLIPCIHEFLVPGSNVTLYHPTITLYEHVKQSASHVSTSEVKQEMIELINEDGYALFVRKNNPKWFFPDDNHANRKAHYKVYELVKERLINESR